MGQRSSHSEITEEVHGVKNGATLTPIDHKAELQPRPDETPVAVGEGGGQEKESKTKKKKQKKRRFRRFSSFFCCLSSPKSTKVVGEQVEQDTDETPKKSCTDDQTSLQDITCTVEDHLTPPVSCHEVSPAEEQQEKDTRPQDQEDQIEGEFTVSCPEVSPSAKDQLEEDTRPQNQEDQIEDHICLKYTLGKMLGEGSFGSIYAGFRRKDDLPVAVKFTTKTENEPYISLPDHPRPVPLEVGLTVMANQGPRCPHIIEVLDWQDHPDQYIMVLERPLECMDMHSFWEHLDYFFNEKLARHFMQQVTDAALMCCSRGVLHRDIKLPNLLVCLETLEVKLIDFGCGDLLKTTPYKAYSGTAKYCPPEYWNRGEYFGKQATVWSLGVLLFRMISSLFPDSSDIGLMDTDVWSQPGFSEECCRFIRGCLKSNPEQRLRLENLRLHDWFKIPL